MHYQWQFWFAHVGVPPGYPERRRFFFMIRMNLAKEEIREHTAGTFTAPAPNPIISNLPNLQNALKSHMHTTYAIA
eukprot:1141271-Pelagomonas_calceolata.AAC.1